MHTDTNSEKLKGDLKILGYVWSKMGVIMVMGMIKSLVSMKKNPLVFFRIFHWPEWLLFGTWTMHKTAFIDEPCVWSTMIMSSLLEHWRKTSGKNAKQRTEKY